MKTAPYPSKWIVDGMRVIQAFIGGLRCKPAPSAFLHLSMRYFVTREGSENFAASIATFGWY